MRGSFVRPSAISSSATFTYTAPRVRRSMKESTSGKINSKRAYTGKVISLDVDTVRFPDGSTGDLEMIRHPGASAVVPFLSDPQGENPQVLLIRQYRYAADSYLYEIPAGRLNAGEAPRDCAARELKEETGCRADSSSIFSPFIQLRASLTKKSISSWQPV